MKILKFHNIIPRLHAPMPPSLSRSYHPKVLQSYRLIVLSSLFLLLSTGLFAQNEANIWYFGRHCGLDFGSGTPVALHDGQTATYWEGYSSICDSSGTLLFYMDELFVFDKNHDIMVNGSDLTHTCFAGRAIVKWPGQDGLYYIISPGVQDHINFSYSIVDLKMNDGAGAITEKNVPVEAVPEGTYVVATAKQDNTDNVWVITRKFEDPSIAAFLVDENGFNPNPVTCVMPDRDPLYSHGVWELKVSYDKKYILISNQSGPEFEVCRFNALTGESAYMYAIDLFPGNAGMEFSPDSKYLYVSGGLNQGVDSVYVYQFDMSLIEDPISFYASAILVGTGYSWGLQLARDGRIYCGDWTGTDNPNYFMNVISKPWIRGVGCSFELCPVSLYPGVLEGTFNNILVDYLLRFEWAGEACQGYAIHFKPNFIPTPQTIQWNFDDGPGSTSWQLSPTYTFKNPGFHEVKVDVWYPSGRYEHTSREIEISPSPLPLLGNDTLICEGASITLNANCEADFFSWSTSQFGVSSITVSDSGTYWVRGRFNDSGCMGYDTIHVGFHPPVQIDETSLIVSPTTCNGASGSITGLAVLGSPPYAYQWLDLSGNPFGTNLDVTGLPAGQYQLTITDGNGCETVSDVYTIEDAGNLQVLDVELIQPHCGRPDGQIVIHAFSPSGSALQYSIDDGATYQTDSVFSGLVGTSYVVRVTDGVGCFGFYIDNPVELMDIPGPQVTQVNVTNETDFLGNGAIDITATGSILQIFYSIDNGATWQTNNGIFSNLSAGTFTCIVKDENDCDTTFIVEIQNIILTFLHAITGPGGHCLGNTAMVPVNVDNFNFVADFHLKLGYNADNLECEGFANINPQLLDSLSGWVDPLAGDIHLAWNSPASVTFTGTEKVADLVFTTKNPGQGELSWYTGETESYFTNSSGNPIPAEFSTGEVTVYEPPEIILEQSKTVCTGQFASLMSIAVGNQPPIDYQWIYPNGDTTDNDPFFFSVTPADAGLYTLLATDHVGCTDQKSIELIVSENPVAAFHGTDTLEMHTGDILDAGTGLSSYRWNTGDSTESIVINAEGMYKVEMESPVGCLGSDSVYVKLTSEEIPDFDIYVPNAFSPNGDGVNDVFGMKWDGLSIVEFRFSIFDRWGGEVFSGEGISSGWDGKKAGKECPGGVYVYKIVYSVDGIPGSQERVGTVALVR
jgi:gliding motility-associated-like protein